MATLKTKPFEDRNANGLEPGNRQESNDSGRDAFPPLYAMPPAIRMAIAAGVAVFGLASVAAGVLNAHAGLWEVITPLGLAVLFLGAGLLAAEIEQHTKQP